MHQFLRPKLKLIHKKILSLTHLSSAIGDADAAPLSPTESIRGAVYINGVTPERQFNLFDLFRYTWSTAATIGSLLIIFYGISIQAYVLPTPPGGTYIIFFWFLVLLFYLEGLMFVLSPHNTGIRNDLNRPTLVPTFSTNWLIDLIMRSASLSAINSVLLC